MASSLSASAADGHLTSAELRQLAAAARRLYHVPAIATAVMNAGRVLAMDVQGVRVFDRPDAVTPDDYFHIGSCAKSVLAVIAAELVGRGKIAWETRFFDLYPEMQGDAAPGYAAITLADLLLSRAGIRAFTRLDRDPIPELGPDADGRQTAFIRHLVRQPPAAKRDGDAYAFLYSNAGYVMASAMLERASGLTYRELVETFINGTLGLAAKPGWPNRLGADQPWGHTLAGRAVEAFGPQHAYRIPDVLEPAGNLSMTPGDFAEYVRRQLAGLRGTEDILPTAAWRLLHFARDGFAFGTANGRLLGRQYTGFDGSAGTFFCRALLVPELDFAVVVMTNAGTGSAGMPAVDWLSRKLIERAFGLNGWQRLWLRLWWG